MESDLLLDWSASLEEQPITLEQHIINQNKEIKRVARVEREIDPDKYWEGVMSGASKDVRQIISRLEKLGYVVRRGGANNVVGLVSPDGEIVRMPLGQPLTIHTTPGSAEAIDGLYNTLKKCGIDLEQEEREMSESNKQETGLDKYRNDRKIRSQVLRERLKELMVEHDLRQTDVYHFGDDYAKTHNIVAPSNTQTFVSAFLRGTALTDKYYEWMERVVNAIAERDGKILKAEVHRKMENKEPLTSEPVKPEPSEKEKFPEVTLVQPPSVEVADSLYRASRIAVRVQGMLYKALLVEEAEITVDDIEKVVQEILELG